MHQKIVMRIIHFDFSDQLLTDQFFAYQLKVSYILSDVLNAIGFCGFAITFEEVQSSMTIDEKATMVDQVEKADGDMREMIDSYLEVRKHFKSLKHPPQNVFLNYKRIQNAIGNVLKEWEFGLVDYFKKTGHAGMLSLCETDGFEFFYSDEGKESEGRLKPVNVLTNQCPKNAIDKSIWSMPTWFYVDNFFDKAAVLNIKSISDKAPYFIKCLDLPNVNFLSIAELTAIKKQISSKIQDFQTKTEIWAQHCYQTKGGSAYFKENIYPTFDSLQDAINENPIIKHCVSQRAGAVMISLFIGEVTPPILWKYYLHFQQITDLEFNQLMEEYKQSEKHTIPVLLFMNVTKELSLTTLPKDEAEIINSQKEVVGLRKHLDID